jgi:hypothetical protein
MPSFANFPDFSKNWQQAATEGLAWSQLKAIKSSLEAERGGMAERFNAPVLKTKKVPRRESLTYERMRTEASEKVQKRTCICQYNVNTSSTEITQSDIFSSSVI